MAVAHDTSIESIRTDTSDPMTWVHTPVGTPRGIAVAIGHGVSATDHVQAVTYGGVAMERIVRATDTADELGAVEWWFLGEDVPTGAQTVSANLATGTTDDIHGISISMTADTDLEVIDFDSLSQDQANPVVTLQAGGRTKLCLAYMYGGGNNPGGTLATGNTADHDVDAGVFYLQACRETTPDNADHTIGWATLASDDLAFVAIAVSEVAANNYSLSCESASYALTGSAVGLLWKRKVAADSAAYAITGAAAGLLFGREIAAAPASYAVNGQDISFLRTYVLAAASSSYAVNGSAVGLLWGHRIVIDSASYLVNGQDAVLIHGTPNIVFPADSAAFAISGSVVGLLWGHKVAANSASYSVTGQDASLLFNHQITASPAGYTVNGSAAGLLWGRKVAAAAASYAATGQAANLLHGYKVAANSASYGVTGSTVGMLYSRIMTASPAVFTVTGQNATLDWSGEVTVVFEAGGPIGVAAEGVLGIAGEGVITVSSEGVQGVR